MNPTASYTTLERFLDHWDGVRMVTLKLLDCFSEEELRHTVWTGSRTVGEMFHHIGAHQFYAVRGLMKGQWEPSGTLEESPDADWDLHKHLIIYKHQTLHHWLERAQQRMRSWAAEVSESRLADFATDNPWHQGMRGWLLLQHAYQDEVHHRGQLYLFARQLGHIPPDVFAVDHPDYWEQRKWK